MDKLVLSILKKDIMVKTYKNTSVVAYGIGILLAMSLAACGGGGSSGGSNNSDHDSNADDGRATQITTAIPSTPASTSTSTTATNTVTTANGTLGKTLYQNCIGCHSLGAKSASAVSANTMAAIGSNKGGMGYLSTTITQTEVDSIALYLANPTAF
jgi:cytochrome c2